jgi:glycosyltransferase involved in cell wall biosynthesis
MRLVLLDPALTFASDHAFATRPRGGIAQATVYLADALAGRGHDVTLACREETGQRNSGVRLADVRQGLDAARLCEWAADGIIVLNDSHVLARVMPIKPPKAPSLLWIHHPPDVRWGEGGRSVHGLETPEGGLADALVFVSGWQKQAYARIWPLDQERCHVIANAVGDVFAALSKKPIAKRKPWKVIFTSAPYNGLDVLLQAWPLILALAPEAELEVLSGLAIYGDSEDQFAPHYAALASLPNARYIGPLPHAALAERLAAATVFVRPGPSDETSCIAAMEALAAGCRVVTADVGALRETCRERAIYVEPYADGLAGRFARAVAAQLTQLDEASMPPPARMPTWAERAEEWEMLIRSL